MRELNLHLTSTFPHASIADFLKELRSIPCAATKAAKIEDFLRRLEVELVKIDAFKRELPLCMILLRRAIKFFSKESIQNLLTSLGTTEPVVQEFFPLEKCKEKAEASNTREKDPAADLAEKREWMSSAKLWIDSSSSYLPTNNNSGQRNLGKAVLVYEDRMDKIRNAGGGSGFMPLKRQCTFPSSVRENRMELLMKNPIVEDQFDLIRALTAATAAAKASGRMPSSSLVYNPQSIPTKKQRRCWDPELHGLFLRALEILGGEKVATPKNILEVMNVDGLTNDEVKSHLQKYRIHCRRLQNGRVPPSPQRNDPLYVRRNLWNPNFDCGESCSMFSYSQLRSPEGPLHLVLNSSTTGGDSMEEDDEKIESQKSPLSRNNNGQ